MFGNNVRKAAVMLAAFTVGRSVWLRAGLFRCARIFRRLHIWAQAGWSGLIFLYLFAGLLVLLHGLLVWDFHFVAPRPLGVASSWAAWSVHTLRLFTWNVRPIAAWFFHGDVGPWAQAIVLAALIAMVRAATRTRRHIVILSFANLSGDENQKDFVNALPRRLMTELAEMADIHSQLRDDPGDLSLDNGPAPRLEVDPTSSATSGLKGALTGVKVPIGPLTIPLDGAVTLLSTLLQGPQIVGSLQTTSEGLLIEASLSGGSHSSTWRVTALDAEKNRSREESGIGIADLMVRQLAYRIFTHLNAQHLGTYSWRAVGHYTEGLRAVREAALERKETNRRVTALERAQQGFFRAFRADARFVRSRYNLGVILFSQRLWQPACEVFQAVVNDIEGDPLPSPPGSAACMRARRDLASAHFAAASALCAQARELTEQRRIDAEWAVMAAFQVKRMEKAARNELDHLKRRRLAALYSGPSLLAKIKDLLKQQRAADQTQPAIRSPEVLLYELKNLRRRVQNLPNTGTIAFRKLVANDGPAILGALSYIVARQQHLVRLNWARFHRVRMRAMAASAQKPPDDLERESRIPWIVDRVDYHAAMALRINPAASNAWNLKGERAGSNNDAHACFRKASALIWLRLCAAEWNNEPTPALLLEAATYLANLSRSNPRIGGAAREIDQALELDPSNAADWVSQGKLHLTMGRFQDALESFQNANRERELGIHWLWIAFTCRAADLCAVRRKQSTESWRKTERHALIQAVEGCAGGSLFPPPAPGTLRAAGPPQSANVSSGISRDGRYELFQPQIETLLQRMRPLNDAQKHGLRYWALRTVQRLQWMLWGIESRKTRLLELASDVAAQPVGTMFPEQKAWIRMLRWIEQSHRTSVAARESLTNAAGNLLGIFYQGRYTIAEEQFEQALWLVLRSRDVGPVEADQRILLASFYLLTGLPDQSQEEITNAVSIRPDRNLEMWLISPLLRKFRDITDKEMRADALRRVVAVCREMANGEAYDFSARARLGTWGYWHFYLGLYSLQLLDYTTAQRCFATCCDRRQYPIESLQLLCYAHFRCGAFEAAEDAYKAIGNLFRELCQAAPQASVSRRTPNAPKRRLEVLLSAQACNALNRWFEVSSPAWNCAMAANHTAAALAEQGLTSEACRRWKISRNWGRLAQQPDRRLFLEAAQHLSHGMILLNAGASAGPVEDPDPLNPPDPAASSPSFPAAAIQPRFADATTTPPPSDTTASATGISPAVDRQSPETGAVSSPGSAAATEDPRVTQLKKAIRCFTVAIGYAQDPANRADANFRIGIACDSLAHLDPVNADSWKRQGRRALRNATQADRRDEYAKQIGPLMKKLAGVIGEPGQPEQTPDPSPPSSKTAAIPGSKRSE
jgi:tetratricopeptide (TPR) repeat protein